MEYSLSIIIILIITIIIINLIIIIRKRYFNYNRIKYNLIEKDDLIRYDKIYHNNKIINYNKKKVNKRSNAIVFNDESNLFLYNYNWMSNEYTYNLIINYRDFTCNNQYYYYIIYEKKPLIQKEILNTECKKLKMIDNKYLKYRDLNFDKDLWYYMVNGEYTGEWRKKYSDKYKGYYWINDINNEKRWKEPENNYKIKKRNRIDITYDEYKMCGDIYVKDIYMFIINYFKYKDIPYLGYLLLSTSRDIIIYHTDVSDKYWGTGEWDKRYDYYKNLSDIKWRYGNSFIGYNILGQILMLIRMILNDEKNIKMDNNNVSFFEMSNFFLRMCLKYNFHIYK